MAAMTWLNVIWRTEPDGSSTQPLAELTRRLASSESTRSTTGAGAYSPQPSLKTTHCTMLGWLASCVTMSASSASNWR